MECRFIQVYWLMQLLFPSCHALWHVQHAEQAQSTSILDQDARGIFPSDHKRGFVNGTRMAGDSVMKNAQLASVSMETMSVFVSIGKTSVNRGRNGG